MTHKVVVSVLYEDSRSTVGQFGLHDLVTRLVADRLNEEVHSLKQQLSCNPQKGDSKLLETLRQKADLVAADCHPIIGVFDGDKICRLLKLDQGGPSSEQIVEKIRDGAEYPQKIHPFILKENIESIIKALHACLPTLATKDLWSKALSKDRTARDMVFKKAAFATTPDDRHMLEEASVDLKNLARKLAELFQS